jgi:hypothetical protein
MLVPVWLLLTINKNTNSVIRCILYFHFCKLGVQQQNALHQDLPSTYKDNSDLHQVDVTGAAVVTGGVEVGAAVEIAELGP